MGSSGASSGGSVAGAVLLPLDTAPASAHAKDDEFSGAALDAKWTAPVTSTRAVTTAVANGWLTIAPNDAAGVRGGYGIRQASPTGSFTVSAKVAFGRTTGASQDSVAGLFVGRLTATAKVNVLGVQHGGLNRLVNAIGATYSHTADWSAFDSFEANTTGEEHGVRYVRIVWISGTSTLEFWYSANGAVWTRVGTRASMQQPEYIGLAIYANTAVNADARLACDWFRVTE